MHVMLVFMCAAECVLAIMPRLVLMQVLLLLRPTDEEPLSNDSQNHSVPWWPSDSVPLGQRSCLNCYRRPCGRHRHHCKDCSLVQRLYCHPEESASKALGWTHMAGLVLATGAWCLPRSPSVAAGATRDLTSNQIGTG